MTLGAGEKKKVIFLCVLGAVALYLVYANLLAGPSVPETPREAVRRASAPAAPSIPTMEPPGPKRAPVNRGRSEEWHLVYIPKRPEDRPDPTKIDPTLKLDLLGKVQQSEPSGGTRNLFQFGQPPVKEAEKPTGLEPRITPFAVVGPRQPAPPGPPPAPPPPPPITLKFYGFSTIRTDGKKTAYFLDGDDILIAAEGETLKRRYRVLRIGPSSVLMEDTESKRQQTVPLTEESQS